MRLVVRERGRTGGVCGRGGGGVDDGGGGGEAQCVRGAVVALPCTARVSLATPIEGSSGRAPQLRRGVAQASTTCSGAKPSKYLQHNKRVR